jgi:hypothetical protein
MREINCQKIVSSLFFSIFEELKFISNGFHCSGCLNTPTDELILALGKSYPI